VEADYRLLLVEDDGYWLDEYYKYLENEGYKIDTARTIDEALDFIDQYQYDAVVTDLKMGGFDFDFGGLDLLERVKKNDPCTEVVIITGYGTHQIAANVKIKGAFDYIKKPPTETVFRLAVRGAAEGGRRKHQSSPAKRAVPVESQRVKQTVDSEQTNLFGVMGNSKEMKVALEKINEAIQSRKSVFLFGELGTGKTHIAAAIHSNSVLKNKPFSTVNFSDLPKYWQSIQRTIALGGVTLFLDNLTDITSDSVELLDQLIANLKTYDVRLIMAYSSKVATLDAVELTLKLPDTIFQAVTQIPVFLPPLRERKDGDDIPALIGHFIHSLTIDSDVRDPVSISPSALERFVHYDYNNGNVKELYAMVTQAVNLIGGVGEILDEHILALTETRSVPAPRPDKSNTPMKYAFVSYYSEDKAMIDKLQKDLENSGIHVWRDRDQLYPGMKWKSKIRNAIREGAVFLACFSKAGENRSSSYVFEELRLAIDELRKQPNDRTWFLPVKINECTIPDWEIGGGETLRDIQYLELFSNWEKGIDILVEVIKKAGRSITP
jgi:DNA-binding NtrC family response regulator